MREILKVCEENRQKEKMIEIERGVQASFRHIYCIKQ